MGGSALATGGTGGGVDATGGGAGGAGAGGAVAGVDAAGAVGVAAAAAGADAAGAAGADGGGAGDRGADVAGGGVAARGVAGDGVAAGGVAGDGVASGSAAVFSGDSVTRMVAGCVLCTLIVVVYVWNPAALKVTLYESSGTPNAALPRVSVVSEMDSACERSSASAPAIGAPAGPTATIVSDAVSPALTPAARIAASRIAATAPKMIFTVWFRAYWAYSAYSLVPAVRAGR